MGDMEYSLDGGALVTPTSVVRNAALTVSGGRIASLERRSTDLGLDLRGHLVFPGLLNPHDHLFGTWWPRVGPNRPYNNVYDWLADYENSPILNDRGQNSASDMYEVGAYRNLVSGVTTVADHFMRIGDAEFYARLPIDVLHEYGRTWTPRERTKWGDDIAIEYRLAVSTGQPYIIHLAEGIDVDTASEMDVLLEANALGRNTMVVHGVALRPQDMMAMARVGASVCWCPGSNLYLYGQTADVPALLKAGVNVTLGTDSSMTGGLNLLDEIRIARRSWREQTGEDASLRWLVELVTTRAAQALMLQERRGRLEPGYEAGLLVLADSYSDPYQALIEAQIGDIVLLVHAGRPIYGDLSCRALFEQFGGEFSEVRVGGKRKLIAGDPVALLHRLSLAVGKKVHFPFLPLTGV